MPDKLTARKRLVHRGGLDLGLQNVAVRRPDHDPDFPSGVKKIDRVQIIILAVAVENLRVRGKTQFQSVSFNS